MTDNKTFEAQRQQGKYESVDMRSVSKESDEKSWRKNTYKNILSRHDTKKFRVFRIVYHLFISALVLISLIPDLNLNPAIMPKPLSMRIQSIDIFISILLWIEYAFRVLNADLHPLFSRETKPRRYYVFSLRGGADFVIAISPILGAFLANGFQFLRLLRIFRATSTFLKLETEWSEFLALNYNRTIRQRIYSILFLDGYSGKIHRYFDLFLIFVIVLAIIFIICDSVAALHIHYQKLFSRIDNIVSAIFLVEYIGRIYAICEDKTYRQPFGGRLRYAVTPGAIVDVIAILPIFIPFFLAVDVHSLWIVRLFRIFKLSRYSPALRIILDVLREERSALGGALFIFVNIIIVAACLLYFVEKDVQPDKFYNIPMAIYWAVVTLTSIGYGDIYPITAIGQFITMLLAVIGIGMVALPAGILANGFVEKLHAQKRDLTKFVAVRTNDSLISKSEQREIDSQINFIGMTPERGRMIEGEIFDRLGVVETHYTDDGLRLVFKSSNDRDKMTDWISSLSRQEKIALLTVLTASLYQDPSKS